MNAAFGVKALGGSRVAAKNARTHVSSHVMDVLEKIIFPVNHASFFVRIYGSVPIASVTVIHNFSPVLYVTRVDADTEVLYSLCALCRRAR